MKNPLSGQVKRTIGKVKRQPAVLRLRQRYPRLWQFVVNRLNTKVFVGLPLTLMVLAFGVNIALLSELTESVLESEWIVTLDKEFTSLLFKVRTDALSQVLYLFTQLGEQATVFILGGLVTALFLYRRNYVAIFVFWFTMAGVGISTRYGKTFFSRERPANVAYYAVEHFSFPSGHATTVIALYGLLSYFLYRHYYAHPRRGLLLWLAGGAYRHRRVQQGVPGGALPVGCAGRLPAGGALAAGGHQHDGVDDVPQQQEGEQERTVAGIFWRVAAYFIYINI